MINKKKILYIHDKKDWAIYNVGKLWLCGLEDNIEINFKNKYPRMSELQQYDYVWFGYHTIWFKKYRKFDKSKTIISVHDPIELRKINKLQLDDVFAVITASVQMAQFLKEKGVSVNAIIPTASSLDTRERSILPQKEKEVRLLTVCSTEVRKNIDGLKNLFNRCKEELGINYTFKFGHKILSDKDYVDLFDSHNVYVCMSKQEGGPIPAMDAMKRGCVVLSTEVGQMPEIINGNGFILKENEFFDKIRWIQGNLKWLSKARRNSIDIISKKRDEKVIKNKVKKLLRELNII